MASWQPLGRIGAVEIARVYELTFLGQTAADFYPKFDRDAVRDHEYWLCPVHFDPESLRLPMDVQSFVLRTPRHTILIDTCCGNDKPRAGAPEFHRLTTGYLDRLQALGVAPESIDYVMCTHLHPDHIGWNTRLVDGRWVPTFPNARYIIAKKEYEKTSQHPAPIIHNSFGDSVLPVVEAGLADLVDDDYEILDLLRLRAAPGHTEGNVQIELASEGALAIFAGDMIHTPMQIPFWQWSSRTCWNPEVATQTRRNLLEQCVEQNALLVPAHFLSPHCCRIRAEDGDFRPVWGW